MIHKCFNLENYLFHQQNKKKNQYKTKERNIYYIVTIHR